IPNSYEYRLEASDKPNEFLYEYYLNGYQDFVQRGINEATRYKDRNSLIIQTDIRSFYTDINQHQLVDLVSTPSKRIKWILDQLLKRPIPETSETLNLHKAGSGLAQGGTASGFFAKLYLQALHKPIGKRERKISLYRYADDIVIVIPY